mmetsp:Transcript_20441/g.24545  ORF Transcript_20441/g.24545 Transcript_20441/m.24545 type:complete len:84 (-) Transcript_20441:2686-2937(-)
MEAKETIVALTVAMTVMTIEGVEVTVDMMIGETTEEEEAIVEAIMKSLCISLQWEAGHLPQILQSTKLCRDFKVHYWQMVLGH